MTTLIKTCRSGRKAEDNQQVVSNADQHNALLRAALPLSSVRCSARLHEKVLQFLEDFLRTFFLEEMAAIETAPGNS